jgi:hypothetical protein
MKLQNLSYTSVIKHDLLKESIKSHSNTRPERNHIILVSFYYFPFDILSMLGLTDELIQPVKSLSLIFFQTLL